MSEEDKKDIEKKCAEDAQQLVDTLFDKNLLNPKLKRKDCRAIEKLITLNTKYAITNHIKGHELLKLIEGNK